MLDSLRRMKILLYKEFCQLLGTTHSRMLLVIPPLMQMIMLGYAATMDLKQVDFAVLDHCQSQASRALTARFVGSTVFFAKRPLTSEADLQQRVALRDIRLALVIPHNFERAMAGLETPRVQIIADGRNVTSAGLAIGYAQKIVEQFSQEYFPETAKFQISSRAWFNPTYNPQYYMVPAMLVMIGFIDIMVLTALSVAREREDGTFDQLLLTPYSSAEILFVKSLSSLFVGSCQLATGLLVVLFWYQIPLNSPLALLGLILFSFLVAAIGVGLLLSVLCVNLQQSLLGATIIAIPCVMLSGLATPVESMPDFFQFLTVANPVRYGILSIQQIFLEGTTLSVQWPSLKILWSIAAVAYGLAWFIFEYQRRK